MSEIETLKTIFLVAVASPIAFVVFVLVVKAYGFLQRERKAWNT